MRNIGLEGFEDALYAVTKNGWMDSEAFVDFLKHHVEFAKAEKIKFPIILFVDGHSTHLSLPAAEFCSANGVILYCLLPNATHILQACDVGLFSPMKSAWHKTVKEWQMTHIGETLTKKQFPALFKTVWDQVTTMENACNGFRRAGLFPLTANGIDKSKLTPSRMAPVATASPSACSQSTLDAEPIILDTLNISDVAAYEEIEDCTTTISSERQDVLPCGDASLEPQLAEDLRRDTSPPRETCTETETNRVLVTPMRRDHDYVSPAFTKLAIPEPKQKKKTVQIRQKLPKAVSGSKALEMLREREALKKAELRAKEERKRERELNKIKKAQEAEEKKRQRELKKKEKELKKLVESKMKKQRKRKFQNDSDSESENDDTKIPFMDSDSDDVLGDVEACPKCLLQSGAADRPEFLLLDKEGIQDIEFACNDCI